MRVLLDTNVLIGYLLSNTPRTTATAVLLALALDGRFLLLLADGVAEELRAKIDQRPDLRARISLADADALLQALDAATEWVPRMAEPFPEVGRDRKDDFVIAHATDAAADVVLTWDKDLLELGRLGSIRFLTPPAFLALLREEG